MEADRRRGGLKQRHECAGRDANLERPYRKRTQEVDLVDPQMKRLPSRLVCVNITSVWILRQHMRIKVGPQRYGSLCSHSLVLPHFENFSHDPRVTLALL